jgi:hypothetical protein
MTMSDSEPRSQRNVRLPAVAGAFYARSPARLEHEATGCSLKRSRLHSAPDPWP